MPRIAASFTRPANTTPYVNGQIVANSTTAAQVLPLDFGRVTGGLTRATIRKSTSNVTAATFRLWLFGVPLFASPSAAAVGPTIASGDGAAFSFSSWAYFVGRFTAASMEANAGATNQAWGVMNPVDPNTNGTIYQFEDLRVLGYLEALGAYTPGSAEIFTVEATFL